MDEISGLLVSGGVLLAASMLTAESSSSAALDEDEFERIDQIQAEKENFDEEIDRELRKQRKRFDAEFENILRNRRDCKDSDQSLIVLSNPFYTSFHKLQDAFQEIGVPTVINTNIKQRYLLIHLGHWFMYSSSLYDPNSESLPEVPDDTLLFQLLVSNGILLTPGTAYGSTEPGCFVCTRDIQSDHLIDEIIQRFKTVQATLEDLYAKPSKTVSTNPEHVSFPTLSEGKDLDEDDLSVSSRTRGKKRSSISTATVLPIAPDTATKRKKKAVN